MSHEIAALEAAGDSAKKAYNDQDRIEWLLSWYTWVKQDVLDPYVPDDPFQCLALVIVALVIGTVIKCGFMVAHSVFVSQLSQQATLKLRQEFYRRTLRMDLARFSSEGTSELMSRFTYDMESLLGGLNELLGKLVREPLKMLSCLVGAALVSWRLLLFSLIVAPVAAFDPLACQGASSGPTAADGRDVGDVRHPGRDLARHQGRQGVHDGADRKAPLSDTPAAISSTGRCASPATTR